MHCYAFSISQLPRCNLFTQHVIYLKENTSSELWTLVQSILLIYHLLLPFTIYFLQETTIFHTIRLNLCFQQTDEIDNLTVSWGKVLWLCCAGSKLLATPWELFPFSYWFDNLGFTTEGNLATVLIILSSWGFPTIHIRHGSQRSSTPALTPTVGPPWCYPNSRTHKLDEMRENQSNKMNIEETRFWHGVKTSCIFWLPILLFRVQWSCPANPGVTHAPRSYWSVPSHGSIVCRVD